LGTGLAQGLRVFSQYLSYFFAISLLFVFSFITAKYHLVVQAGMKANGGFKD
jgi:hypothetical protein